MTDAFWSVDERGAVLELESLAVVLEVAPPVDVPEGLSRHQSDTLASVLEDPEGWVDRARAFVGELDVDVVRSSLSNVEIRVPAREPLVALVADWSADPERGLSVVFWGGRARRWGGRAEGMLWRGPST